MRADVSGGRHANGAPARVAWHPDFLLPVVTAMIKTETHFSRLRREAAATLRLGFPLIVSQLSVMAMNFVDAVIAGRLGAESLAAVALGTAVWSLALLWLMGVLMALPPIIAQLRGAQCDDQVGGVLSQAVWMMLGMVSIIYVLLGQNHRLFAMVGVEPPVAELASEFLAALVWGLPAVGLYLVLRNLSEGIGKTQPGMYFGVAGLIALAPLAYAFSHGRWGAPDLGAVGCGVANAIVFWLQALGMLILVTRHHWYRGLGLLKGLAWPRLKGQKELLRLGLPIGVAIFMEGSLFTAVALLVGGLGTIAVAAHQVALNVASMSFMIPLGLAMAVTVRVGHAAGRGDTQGLRDAGMAGIGLTVFTQGLSATAMLAIPGVIAAVYTPDLAVQALAVQLLFLAAVFQFSDGVQVVSAGALRGLKDTRLPMIITVVSYWCVGMPIGAALAFWMGYGVHGLWMGLIAGLSMAGILLFIRFERRSRLSRTAHYANR